MTNKYSDKYYYFILNPDNTSPVEERIVFSIIRDFTDRKGLRQEWENIDDDIQGKIIETWLEITKKQLTK
jgi:hypothetical protein